MCLLNYYVCLSLLSITVINTMTMSNLGEERVYLVNISMSQSTLGVEEVKFQGIDVDGQRLRVR